MKYLAMGMLANLIAYTALYALFGPSLLINLFVLAAGGYLGVLASDAEQGDRRAKLNQLQRAALEE